MVDRFILMVAGMMQWLFSWVPFYSAKVYTHKFKVGDVVVCINAMWLRGSLTDNKEYKVIAVGRYKGMDEVKIVDDKNSASFHSPDRFQLKSEWKPLQIIEHPQPPEFVPAFNLGDKVVCVKGGNGLLEGKEYQICGYSNDGYCVAGVCGIFSADHFELKKEITPAKLEIGDVVVCIKEFPGWLTVGKEYEVKKNINGICLVGDNGREGMVWEWSGYFTYEYIQLKSEWLKEHPPVVKEEVKFDVGDIVVCVEPDGDRQRLIVGEEYKISGFVDNDACYVDGQGDYAFLLRRFKMVIRKRRRVGTPSSAHST